MTYIRIALRNLIRQKKRSFLLGGAIVFGVLVITLINGFSLSFLKNTASNFSDFMGGHLFIDRQEKLASGKIVTVIKDDTQLLSLLDKQKQYIRSLTRRSIIWGSLIADRKNLSLKIEGINWKDEPNFKSRVLLKQGTWDEIINTESALLLTESNARRLNVQLNDYVLCKVETVTGQLNVAEFILKGIIAETGLLGGLSAYAGIAAVNTAIDIGPGSYNSLNLFLNNYQDVDKVAALLLKEFKAAGIELTPVKVNQGTLPDETEETWEGERYQLLNINDVLGQIKSVINGLNIVGFVILAILVIIIMVGISNTYRMVVYERVREIGTMRSVGMQRSEVKWLFYLEAFFLSLVSILAGTGLGFLILWLISLINFGLENPLNLFMKNGHISFELNIVYTLLVAVFVLLTILVAVGFPARKAARLNPAKALGKHY